MTTKLLNDNPSLTDNVSEHYKKFFDKFVEIEKLPVNEWKTLHILSYVCKRYEDHYGIKYTFKFNNPAPSKSYEIWQVKKLANMLSAQPTILKNYIDWIFETHVVAKKKRITSLGFITNADLVNTYKFDHLLNPKAIMVKRSDHLPQNVAAMCARNGLAIHTYGELALAKKMADNERLFEELQAINFQLDVLDKIA